MDCAPIGPETDTENLTLAVNYRPRYGNRYMYLNHKQDLLMYADDICIVNDSVGRLQNQLNVLGTFCKKYGYGVNLSKTKVVTFRNGGPLRSNDKWKILSQRVKVGMC